MDAFQSLNKVLKEWSVMFLEHRIADAKAKIEDVSGESLRSFRIEMIEASTSQLGRVLLSFAGSLRILDMRNIKYPKGRSVEVLKKWVKQRGLSSFSRFKRGNKTDVQFVNSIAWAVGRTKKKLKRKQWYNKSKEKDIGVLYRRLLNDLGDNHIKELKAAARGINN